MKVERRGEKDEEQRGDEDELQTDIRLPNYANVNTRRDRKIDGPTAEQTEDEEKDKYVRKFYHSTLQSTQQAVVAFNSHN